MLLAGEARLAGLEGWGNILDFAKSAVFLFWFILACKSLFGIRSSRLVIGLTALALPLHGYAAIAKDLRGPSHYHGATKESAHAHGGVERHFHAHGEAAIEVDDGAGSPGTPSAGTGKSGAPGGLDTQSPAPARVPVQDPRLAVATGEIRAAALPFPSRLERPPASSAIPRIR